MSRRHRLDSFSGRRLLAVIAGLALVAVATACSGSTATLRTASSPTPAAASNVPTAATSRSGAGGRPAGASVPAPGAAQSSPSIASNVPSLPPQPSTGATFQHGITVQGSGTVKARPDTAIISAGVQTRAATAKEAQTNNSQTMTNVLAAIRAHGVVDTDIQTSGISLYPVYEKGNTISGYSATNNVTVTVNKIDQAGTILDAAVQAGANQATSIRFTLKNTDELRDQALAAAAKDARNKADALAAALGLKITGVAAVSEGSVSYPNPIFRTGAASAAIPAAAPSVPVPVEPGQLTSSAQVTIVFTY